jgi:hypothetical protein
MQTDRLEVSVLIHFFPPGNRVRPMSLPNGIRGCYGCEDGRGEGHNGGYGDGIHLLIGP